MLASRDGKPFLARQLQTIAAQRWPEIDLWVSDDGSTDGTLAILDDAVAHWSKGFAQLTQGPQTGNPSDNFRALLLGLESVPAAVALADQDDLWAPDKIERAMAALSSYADRPAVYCGRTQLIDAADRDIGLSPAFNRPPSFRNALVQSLAGGNTMVLNAAAAELVRESLRRTSVLAHDWWIYMIVSGAGGAMHYDLSPTVKYRQHGNNAVGSNSGLNSRVDRLRKVFAGRFREWNDRNQAALDRCRDLLTPEANRTLDVFAKMRSGGPLSRLAALRKGHFFRQTAGGNIMLVVACALGLT